MQNRTIVGGLAILVSGAFLVNALQIESRFPMGVDSGLFPEIVSIALGAIGLFVLMSRGRASAPCPVPAVAGHAMRRVAMIFALLLLYAGLMPRVGFLASTIPCLWGLTMLLSPYEQRRPVIFAVVSTVVAVVIHLGFTVGFGVMLPRGVLG